MEYIDWFLEDDKLVPYLCDDNGKKIKLPDPNE